MSLSIVREWGHSDELEFIKRQAVDARSEKRWEILFLQFCSDQLATVNAPYNAGSQAISLILLSNYFWHSCPTSRPRTQALAAIVRQSASYLSIRRDRAGR